jgi:hypothetical protein
MNPAVNTHVAESTPSVWTVSYNARMRADLVAAACLPPVILALPCELDMPLDEIDGPLGEEEANGFEAWCDLRHGVQKIARQTRNVSSADVEIIAAVLKVRHHEAVVKLACLGPTWEELAAITLVCDPVHVSLGVLSSPDPMTLETCTRDYLQRVGAKTLEDLGLLQRQELLLWMCEAESGDGQGSRFAYVREALGLPRDYHGGAVAFVGEPTDGTHDVWDAEEEEWQKLPMSATYAAWARALEVQQ